MTHKQKDVGTDLSPVLHTEALRLPNSVNEQRKTPRRYENYIILPTNLTLSSYKDNDKPSQGNDITSYPWHLPLPCSKQNF